MSMECESRAYLEHADKGGGVLNMQAFVKTENQSVPLIMSTCV